MGGGKTTHVQNIFEIKWIHGDEGFCFARRSITCYATENETETYISQCKNNF